MRVAGIEDEWIFDMIPRPKDEMREDKKKQIIQVLDPDTVIAVTLARLKNLEDLNPDHGIWTKSWDLPVLFERKYPQNLKKVRLDMQPLPYLVGTPRPSDWDTYSPYNPKSMHRRTLQHLLSLPYMESIACVAADRKYSFIDEYVNRENMDVGDMDMGDSDAEDFDVEFVPIEQPYKNLISLSFFFF